MEVPGCFLERMTNLEYIRKASAEELAKFMEKKMSCYGQCFLVKRCHDGCRKTIRDWLERDKEEDK